MQRARNFIPSGLHYIKYPLQRIARITVIPCRESALPCAVQAIKSCKVRKVRTLRMPIWCKKPTHSRCRSFGLGSLETRLPEQKSQGLFMHTMHTKAHTFCSLLVAFIQPTFLSHGALAQMRLQCKVAYFVFV